VISKDCDPEDSISSDGQGRKLTQKSIVFGGITCHRNWWTWVDRPTGQSSLATLVIPSTYENQPHFAILFAPQSVYFVMPLRNTITRAGLEPRFGILDDQN
jgi:hypothetical protein